MALPLKARGFTLVEIAVVLVIMGLIAAMLLAGVRGATASAKYRATNQALLSADAALVAYAMLNKALPCPAPATTGVAPGACPNDSDQANGVVPWASLGVTKAEVTDGFGNLITYRVAKELVAAGAMNWSMCDPAATPGVAVPVGPPYCDVGCTVGSANATCTPATTALTGRGLNVQGPTGLLNMKAGTTGAAYVLISHGENIARAISAQGGFTGGGTAGAAGPGNNEQVNGVDRDLQATYQDLTYDATDSATHFDDVLLHPTVLNVATRAALAPRAH